MKRAKSLSHRMDQEVNAKEQLLQNLETVDPLEMHYQPGHHQQLLKVNEVQLGYAQPLFEPTSFEINRGEIIALTGPNGIGKSTLIQAITGRFDGQMTGTIDQPKLIKISQARQLYADNTGSLEEFAEQHQLDYPMFLNNLRKLGMERTVFNTPIEHMSMGQQKKVELAKSLTQEAELFIWDEPLNYLDIFNQEQLEQLLTTVKPAMLLIDHDLDFIERVATKQVELRRSL